MSADNETLREFILRRIEELRPGRTVSRMVVENGAPVLVPVVDERGNPKYAGAPRLPRTRLIELLRHAAGQSNLPAPLGEAWERVRAEVDKALKLNPNNGAVCLPWAALDLSAGLMKKEASNG